MSALYCADKITVAGCQLDTAIELIFGSTDPVSAAVLIHGAWNIAKDLLVKKGIETSHTWMAEIWPNLKQNEIYNNLNHVWNFCKHADKDFDKTIQFSPDYIESALMLALHDFSQLSIITSKNVKSKLMDTYELWFIAKKEEFYKGHKDFHHIFVEASELFPNLSTLTPEDQAKAGFDMILSFRQQQKQRNKEATHK